MIFDALRLADGVRETRVCPGNQENAIPTLKLRREVRNATLLMNDILSPSPGPGGSSNGSRE